MQATRTTLRYQVESSRVFPGMWAVVDIFTGLPVVIDDVAMDCMDAYEADDLVDMMNLKDFRARGLLRPGP